MKASFFEGYLLKRREISFGPTSFGPVYSNRIGASHEALRDARFVVLLPLEDGVEDPVDLHGEVVHPLPVGLREGQRLGDRKAHIAPRLLLSEGHPLAWPLYKDF